MSLFNKTKTKFMDMITFKNKPDDGTLKTGSIVLIVIIIGGAARHIYSNEFVKSRGILNDLIFMVLLGLVITAILYFLLLIKENSSKVSSQNIFLSNEDIDTAEEKFEDFFADEASYLKFKDKAIEIGLINEKCEWLFKEKEVLYFVLLVAKLKQKKYLKSTIHWKSFCEVSNTFLKIPIDASMLTKYNPEKSSNLLKSYHHEYFDKEYSVFD
jgi:hypothetical protein